MRTSNPLLAIDYGVRGVHLGMPSPDQGATRTPYARLRHITARMLTPAPTRSTLRQPSPVPSCLFRQNPDYHRRGHEMRCTGQSQD
jgi:hypothetical protein